MRKPIRRQQHRWSRISLPVPMRSKTSFRSASVRLKPQGRRSRKKAAAVMITMCRVRDSFPGHAAVSSRLPTDIVPIRFSGVPSITRGWISVSTMVRRSMQQTAGLSFIPAGSAATAMPSSLIMAAVCRRCMGTTSLSMYRKGSPCQKETSLPLPASTGNSTGPHCHFEVEINGQAVDPMGYL